MSRRQKNKSKKKESDLQLKSKISNFFQKYINPYLPKIIGGIITAIIAGLILYCWLLPIYSDIQTQNKVTSSWEISHNYEQSMQYDKAIDNYYQILNEIPQQRLPYQYAKTQQFLGEDYQELNNYNADEQHLNLAIQYLHESLAVFTIDKYPNEFGTSNEYLGLIYLEMADIRNAKDNLQNSINAFNSTLLVCNESTVAYARTKAYLSIAYRKLSKIENYDQNYNNAITNYNDSLKVVNSHNDPYDYALIKVNCAPLLDTPEEQIEAYSESLNVFTIENNRYEYAIAQAGLGNSYNRLIPRNESNLQNAIDSYNNALQIYTEQKFPFTYAEIQNNLGLAYIYLGTIRDPGVNFEKANSSFSNALHIRTPDTYPLKYAGTEENIAIMYAALGDVKNNETTRQLAEDAFSKAFHIFTPDRYPAENQQLQSNHDLFQNIIQGPTICGFQIIVNGSVVYQKNPQGCPSWEELEKSIKPSV
ncbi:MAG: hypothetical protein ABR887_00775 [Methanoregulaceae archaeon]|jgi:tetratricopeptide (TPR) repeat protein